RRREVFDRLAVEVLLHGRLPDPTAGVTAARPFEVQPRGGDGVALEAGARAALLVDADHRRAGDLRGVADVPDGRVAVDRPGLAGLRTPVGGAGTGAGAFRHDAGQQRVHRAGHVGGDHALAARVRHVALL